jgi:outer membrane protein assembly factor BamB
MRSIWLGCIALLLTSCVFGPVKELKYQIEDSWDEGKTVTEPTPLKQIYQKKGTQTVWEVSTKSSDANKSLDFIVRNEKVIVLLAQGRLLAINQADGNIIWDKQFDAVVTSGLGANNNHLLFTSQDGYVWCLDLDGELLWKSYAGMVDVQPLVLDGSVIVRRNDNQFIEMKLIDGRQGWTYQAPTPPLTVNDKGKMLFSDGVIYTGLPAAKLIALEAATGALIWEAAISRSKGASDIDRVIDITSIPVIDNELIFTASMNGDTACLDRRSAQNLWSRPLSSFVGVTDHLDEVLVVHESNSIYSLDKISGETNWRNADLVGRNLTKGIIVDDMFVVGDYEGILHTINIGDGKLVGRTYLGKNSPVVNNMMIGEDDSIIVMNEDGSILKLVISDIDIPLDESKVISEEGGDAENSTTLKLFDKLKDAILD